MIPTGEIVADKARGTMMGNRGILHGADGRLGRARWRHKAWICCVLSFKDRQRAVMTPGQYTELFFLDEAVAMAAGHRPCAECRRAAYLGFRAAWGGTPRAAEIDKVLHAERLDGRAQRRAAVDLAGVPDGAMVLWQGAPHLVRGAALRAFSPSGYGPRVPRPAASVEVAALTPPSLCRTLAAGYRPVLHPSAD